MHTNLSCAFQGCLNPIIGQCQGYKGSCGRFYCAIHSTGNLCANCAKRKLEEETAEAQKQLERETAQKVYEDYLQTAEKIYKDIEQPMGILIGIVFLGTALLPCVAAGSPILFLGIGGGFALLFILFTVLQKQVKVKVATIATTKPKFTEFYDAWKKEKAKKQFDKRLSEVGTVGAIVLGVAATASKASREAQIRDDLSNIRDKLEKL